MVAEDRPVIVVGAGFAGLAAATALKRARVPVLVLEAKDRVGGRVRTDYDLLPGHPIEAGAMMVHGSDASVLAWIREFGLQAEKVAEYRGTLIAFKGKLRGGLGMALSGLESLRSTYQTLRKFPKLLAHYNGPDMTLDRFLVEHHALPTARQFVGAMYGGINAAEPDEISVRGLAEEAHTETGGLPWANYQVVGGYDAVAKRRADQLGDAVRLGTRVASIAWSADGVAVQADSAEGPETWRGAAAVITVSLGVLQARTIRFTPALPPEKERAIDAVGYGNADKILLVFDETVRRTRIGRATSIALRDGSWYFLPYVREGTGPVVLEGFLAGRKAKALAGRPQEEVVDAILEDFEALLPGVDLRGHLLAARYVDWTSDLDVRGGYTFPKVGGGQDQRRALAAPVDGVLFFAGEATHLAGQYATVHGAVDSGERAAAEVLRTLGG